MIEITPSYTPLYSSYITPYGPPIQYFFHLFFSIFFLNISSSLNRSTRKTPCKNWASLDKWNKFHPTKFPDSDLDSNYCRNPDNDAMGPWCFISLSPRKFQYCKIPLCKKWSFFKSFNTNFLGSRNDPVLTRPSYTLNHENIDEPKGDFLPDIKFNRRPLPSTEKTTTRRGIRLELQISNF